MYVKEKRTQYWSLRNPIVNLTPVTKRWVYFYPLFFFLRVSYLWTLKILHQKHIHAFSQLVARDQCIQKFLKGLSSGYNWNQIYSKTYSISLLMLSSNIAHCIVFENHIELQIILFQNMYLAVHTLIFRIP